MLRKRKVLAVVAVAVIVFTTVLFAEHARDRRKAAEREARYQTILGQYTGNLKPGMNREQVERYLQTNGARFKQMCCVAIFRREYVSLDRAAWDDLVKIADESAPFACSENNVYVAFEFNPKSQGESSGTNGFDVLKKVSIFHQLEGCL